MNKQQKYYLLATVLTLAALAMFTTAVWLWLLNG
jgi:hypothetical protein